MTEERILSAVERIDDAMTRIEAAAQRPAMFQSPAAPGDENYAELSQRHDTMRKRVEAAVAELDLLMRNG